MNEFSITKKDLEPIYEAIKKQNRSLNRIELALIGDEAMKIEGMASKVEKHDRYISRSKQRLGFWSTISAGIGYFIHLLIHKLK